MRHLIHHKVWGKPEAQLSFAVIVGVCLLISLMTLLGVDFGFNASHVFPVNGGASALGGTGCYLHTILEWSCVFIGVLMMMIAFAHYLVKQDVPAVILVVAIYFSSLAEMLYILSADGVIVSGGSLEHALPVLWGSLRVVRAVALAGVCVVMLSQLERSLRMTTRMLVSLVLIGSFLFLSIGAFFVYFFTFSIDSWQGSTLLTGRNLNIAALLIFLLAGLVVFPRFCKRFPSYTALGVFLSVVPDIMAQVHTTFGMRAMFDTNFHVSLVFKTMGYGLPLLGLLLDYYRGYLDEGQAVVTFKQAEERLKIRLMELEDSTQRQVDDDVEREAAEKAFRVLDRAIAASSCGIIITDPRDLASQIIYVNPAFERITGYGAEDAIGQNLDFLYAQERDQPAAQEVAEAIADARECRVVIRNYRKDGRMIWSELDISPVPDENGVLSHYIGIMTDITDRVRADEEHKKFLAKLEHTNRELQDFVHVASHDLQEPLRKVQVFGDRLLAKCTGLIPEEGLVYLERMQNSVRRMDQLIRDLLTYSRVGRKEQSYAQVDLNVVLADVLSDLEVRIEETRGTIEAQPLPSLEADATQMRQLFQNLIGNALKFHRDNVPPVVKIWSENVTLPIDGQPTAHVRLQVQDNGIGFDEKYLERIFTVFQRLHTGNHYAGTGLGLTVCRKICERHGGTIQGKSEPGSGALFIVTLPVAPHS